MVVYSATQPDAESLGYPAGTVWVDSSVDVDTTISTGGAGAAFSEFLLIGA